MEWSNGLCIELIDAYRDRPVLWDVTHAHYKLISKKNDAWSEVANQLQCDVEEVKKKMNSLLASFRRERRKHGVPKAGTDNVYVSQWFAFGSLYFLMDNNHSPSGPRRAIVTDKTVAEGAEQNYELEGEEEEEEDEGTQENIKDSSDFVENRIIPKYTSVKETITPKKRPLLKRKPIVQEDPRVTEAYKLMKTVQKQVRDECSVYTEHIANKLRSYDTHTRAIVEHLINNILFEADMGKYNEQPE